MGGDADDTVLSAVVAGRRLEAVQRHFAGLGFQTTPPMAGSFSITAPRRRFVEVFDAVDPDRFGDTWLSTRPAADLELPLDRLGDVLGDHADAVDAIFFTPTPDFGPDNP